MQALVQEAMSAALQKNNQALELVKDLSKELGVTEDAVANFFRILGEQQVPPEKLLDTLAAITDRHTELALRAGSLQSDDFS